MPVDYSKYPADWKTVIRPRILQRAENACEFCGTVNYTLLGTVRCCPDPAFDGQELKSGQLPLL